MPLCAKNSDFRKGRKSSTDTSMPDYPSIQNQTSRIMGRNDSQFTGWGFQSDEDVHMSSMKAPTNTPTNVSGGSSAGSYESSRGLWYTLFGNTMDADVPRRCLVSAVS